jgi:hypothetical protein
MAFYYNPCEDVAADCGAIFDKKTRKYIEDPKERLKAL